MGNSGGAHAETGPTSTVRSYKDLFVWRKAVDLGLRVYELTHAFPDEERFGLISQLRRGGVSVASNIAEGYGRGSTTDYLRFLKMSRGALFEIETQMIFAKRLNYTTNDQHKGVIARLHETTRLLAALINSLDRSR